MKIKFILMIVGSAFALSSCGEKKADSAEGSGSETSAVKVDTAEGIVDEVADEFQKLGEALKTVKDKESAEAAAEKIKGIGESLIALSKRAKEVKEPSEEEKQALDAKMKEKVTAMQKDMGPAMQSLMSNPEAAEIIMKSMQDFAEKMKEAEEGFKRLGKDTAE